MRVRLLKWLGVTAAVVVAAQTALFAQAAQTAPAGGRQGGAQQAAPQSPTFARIQARTYEFKEGAVTATLPYEVYVPTKYDKSRPTPLIVALHGLDRRPASSLRRLWTSAGAASSLWRRWVQHRRRRGSPGPAPRVALGAAISRAFPTTSVR
jgi:predicted peptidase